jgi:hypothetical protein
MAKRRWFLTGGIVITVLIGAWLWTTGLPFSPAAAVASGRASIPRVAEFDRLFPGSIHFISYFTGTHGPPMWNSKIGLHGRYVLSMQMPIKFNLLRNRVTSFGEPKFYLQEVSEIQPSDNGVLAVRYQASQEFSLREWQALVRSGGDLHVIDPALRTESPVPLFDTYWRGNN